MCSLMVEKMTPGKSCSWQTSFSQLAGSHYPQTTYCGFMCGIFLVTQFCKSKSGRGPHKSEHVVCLLYSQIREVMVTAGSNKLYFI